MTPAPRRALRRAITDWLTEGRITRLETDMSLQSDAFAELDGQLAAVDAYINGEDAADAAEVAKRTQRIRDLLAAVNPENPAPAPGDSGAVVPDPSAPLPTDDDGSGA